MGSALEQNLFFNETSYTVDYYIENPNFYIFAFVREKIIGLYELVNDEL